MLGKYLGAAVVALCLTACVAVAAWCVICVDRDARLARAVAQQTELFREALEEPREELLAEGAFPEGRVLEAVANAWTEGVASEEYPRALPAPPSGPAESASR
jgi:hypothetical protein